MEHSWADDNPYYLVISGDRRGTMIDLGEAGWATKYCRWLRLPGAWVLRRKSDDANVLMVWVHKGDQPYYTAHHVGITSSAGGNEIIAYGIGKKRPDGSVNRMWILPNGCICSGDDVDDIGVRMVKALGPK